MTGLAQDQREVGSLMAAALARGGPIVAGGSFGGLLHYLVGRALQPPPAVPVSGPWAVESSSAVCAEHTESCEVCAAGDFNWQALLVELLSRGSGQQGLIFLLIVVSLIWGFFLGVALGAVGTWWFLSVADRQRNRDKLQGYVTSLTRGARHG